MNDMRSTLPIGVFDSGLGGLTVLKALRERFTHENFIYLGDTARIPYGAKSPRTIRKYLEQTLKFLLEQKVKALVVACNSASSVIDGVEAPVPLYNVIEPGARAALAAYREGLQEHTHAPRTASLPLSSSLSSATLTLPAIGVIATKATVLNRSYVTQLGHLDPSVQVYQQACPLLVPLVEEGWDDDPITNLIVHRYLSPLLKVNINTLVLGCTHYPILKNSIRKVTGAGVRLIDSGEAVADQMEADFQSGRLPANHSGLSSTMRLLTTDVSDNFQAMAARILHPLSVPALELVDI